MYKKNENDTIGSEKISKEGIRIFSTIVTLIHFDGGMELIFNESMNMEKVSETLMFVFWEDISNNNEKNHPKRWENNDNHYVKKQVKPIHQSVLVQKEKKWETSIGQMVHEHAFLIDMHDKDMYLNSQIYYKQSKNIEKDEKVL